MIRAFKFRIYPTRAQEQRLARHLEICCEVYNAALQERREAWSRRRINISYAQQSRQMPLVKQDRPEVGEVQAQVLQQTLRRAERAINGFFARIKIGDTPGYPRYKPVRKFRSLTWPQGSGFRIDGRTLRLAKIGHVRIKLHRQPRGLIKTCTVRREVDRWFAVITCADVPPRVFPVVTSGDVGIDVGVANIVALSTGEKVPAPRFHRQIAGQKASIQSRASRAKRGSARWRCLNRRIGRLMAKEKNQRRDFQHKLAHRIVSSFAGIAVEDLETRDMMLCRKPNFTRAVSDTSMVKFLAIIEAKAEEAARRFAKVPPYGTSSTCSRCGAYRKKGLSERLHTCDCGLVLDRDINASLNILRLGRSLWAGTFPAQETPRGVVTTRHLTTF